MPDEPEFTRSVPGETAAEAEERRRPGRPGEIAPALIPLLRGELAETPYDQHDQFGDPDQLSSLKGILTGTVMALVPWALIGGGVWMVFFR